MEFIYKGVSAEKLDFDEFCEFLKLYSTDKKAKFDEKLIKTNARILGLKSSEIQLISKYLLKNGYGKILLFPLNRVYEIDLIAAKTVADDNKKSFAEKKEFFRRLFPSIDNWALCDGTVCALKYRPEEYEEIKEFAEESISSEREFPMRCGILLLMRCSLPTGRIDDVFELTEKVPYGRYYYTDMACAWLFATALISHKNAVLDYLEKSEKINDFTYIKSLRKAIESYRINSEDKKFYSELIKRRKSSSSRS